MSEVLAVRASTAFNALPVAVYTPFTAPPARGDEQKASRTHGEAVPTHGESVPASPSQPGHAPPPSPDPVAPPRVVPPPPPPGR